MVPSESCQYLAWKCTTRPGNSRKGWKPIKWSAMRDPKVWSGLLTCYYGEMPTEHVIMQIMYMTKHNEMIKRYFRKILLRNTF